MEEQFNKEAKQGWRPAADVARITARSPKRLRAVRIVSTRREDFQWRSTAGAFIGKEEGAFTSIQGNERRMAQTWLTVCEFLPCTLGTRKVGHREMKL